MDERTADDQELRDLMRRYQSGDPIAIEHLVRRISPALLRYFAGSLSGRNEAEDLLQVAGYGCTGRVIRIVLLNH